MRKTGRILGAVLGFATVPSVGASAGAETAESHGVGGSTAIPYHAAPAPLRALSTATIPMATIGLTASKDGRRYTETIVGASPFAATKGATVVKVVIVPVIVDISGTVFNPTAIDGCLSGSITPLAALQQSPVLDRVAFDGRTGAGHAARINGVNVGLGSYPDAFRRAEFWADVKGTRYHTVFSVTTTSPWTISASTVNSIGGGRVLTSNCASLGVLPYAGFRSYLESKVIPAISVIKPTAFAFFLLKDVVTTNSSQLNCVSSCYQGFHSALGSPVQTYGVGEYDSTRNFWNHPGVTGTSVIAHEFGEWMDDPLVTNPTPPWGDIGQVSGCQSNWEVGDPLSGTDFPAIPMANGLTYSMQELAFVSWYFNGQTNASLGAGGKFSSNGTFGGPAKDCPPGGTY
jgi:hypothetical protein